jgi:glycosyltransferase involved in cell wall biosynthesis
VSPHRIALVSDWFWPTIGGVEKQLVGLACQLRLHGYAVEVITTTPGPSSFDGMPVHRLDLRTHRKFSVVCDHRAYPMVEALVREREYDVVHGHGVASLLAQAGVLAGNRLGVPTIMTNHSLAHGTPSERTLLRLYPTIGSAIAAVVFRQWIWPTRSLMPSLFTSVSRSVLEHTRLAYRRTQGLVIPNGVEAEFWKCSPVAHERPRITCVSRLFPSKGVDELVRIMPRIIGGLPSSRKPVLTIIGDGRCAPQIDGEIERLGLQGDVERLGFQPQARIREVFRRSDLFALPCRREGFGIAAAEARAAGLPVLAMAGCGVGEVVEHGRHGLLAKDYGELADNAISLLRDDAARARLAAGAREPMPEYAWQAVAGRYIEAYESLLGELETFAGMHHRRRRA